jgi:membrane peptidoglycan carboxypeptidase
MTGVAGRIAVVSVAAGLLVAAIIIPFTGLLGVATRDAAKTFNDLSVPALGHVPTRSEIMDSQGHLIAYYYPGGIYRIPVSYNHIAPVMRDAIIAIEDSRFYLHGAMDPRGTVRAFINDVNNNPVQGGSTLAQQYVKNALILTAHTTAEKLAAQADTPERKIRELRIAANVEHELTKPQLLSAYLNVAFFNNNAYGIQVAAERYFKTSAQQLTLSQAALLAGMVENPTADNPFLHPKHAKQRRNIVLARMAQLNYITQAAAAAAAKKGLGLHRSTIPLQTGCYSSSARHEAFFCDYVLAVLRTDKAYKKVYADLNTTGGLRIYTTMSARDERSAQNAVNYIVPDQSSTYNPNHNADAEVLIQPRTGRVRGIAVDRHYGTGPADNNIDYAVDAKYDGGAGVQTGSSSKLFTLITALKQGTPFGFTQKIVSPSTIGPYYNCKGQFSGSFPVHNAEGAGKGTFSLYTGTTQSINVFYAMLEQKVGLCNVVKTAVSMGVHRANGRSLLKAVGRPFHKGYQESADSIPSFTLGSINVSPMSMAAAYATVAARGIYCKPVAIDRIVTSGGKDLPVESAGCHRVFSAAVADAASHILQGVLTSGTAVGRSIGRPAAAKTGTANSGTYAAFGGYTPTLAGYVSVFNPVNPTNPAGEMIGYHACYRELTGGVSCPTQMFGANAPGATWQMTFLHAALGPVRNFVPVPTSSEFYSAGSGVISSKPAPPKHHHGGGGGGNGPGPSPSPGHGHGGTPVRY